MIITIDLMKAAKELMISQLPIAEREDIIYRAIELAVIEIYKRFNLSVNSAKLAVSENIHEYPLDENGVDDFSKLITIMNNKGEELIPLNTIDSTYYDYKLINFNRIYIKEPKNEFYTYIYKGSAPTIYKTEEELKYEKENNPDKEPSLYKNINIPRDFYGVLLDYIAYRCHVTLNSNNVYMTEIDLHYKRFELSCSELDKYGYKQEIVQTWKSRDLGFV